MKTHIIDNTISPVMDISNLSVDPIEKKPFYHFRPNSSVLSVGGYGCSLKCNYCQNWKISQHGGDNKNLKSCKEIVDIAIENKVDGVGMTYNEPTVYYEYLLNLFDMSKKAGMFTFLKTNAFIEREFWNHVCEYSDAINIDLKGGKKSYHDVAGIEDDDLCYSYILILENIIHALNSNAHVEISIPIYPNSNGITTTSIDDEHIEDITKIICDHDKNTPVHLLKIFPAYKNNHWKSTDDDLIFYIRDTMMKKIPHVYVQNIFSPLGKSCRKTYDVDGNILAIRENYKTQVLCDSFFILKIPISYI